MNEYLIEYDHGKYGSAQITGIKGQKELKKTIDETKKKGHNDIIIWKRINSEEIKW